MRNQLVKNIFEIAKADKNCLLITGDLGFGILDEFKNDLPNQFINAGIAEQNMMSVASGASHCGKKVFVYSIGNFNTLRCIEQIRNDCCYHEANVNIISVGAGVAYGALGMSHHATEDIAMMRVLPNMTIFSPATRREVDLITPYLKENIGTSYIRLGKGGEKEIHAHPIKDYVFGDPIVIDDEGDVLIVATGAIAGEVMEAKDRLVNCSGIKVAVATLPILKPINEQKIIELIAKYKNVVTVEEHSIIGGLGGIIAEIIATNNIKSRLSRIGIDNLFASIVGDRNYLLDKYCLGVNDIVQKVKELVE